MSLPYRALHSRAWQLSLRGLRFECDDRNGGVGAVSSLIFSGHVLVGGREYDIGTLRASWVISQRRRAGVTK
jgi:hypothetical protein